MILAPLWKPATTTSRRCSSYDGSLHVTLAQHYAADVIAKGWGVTHPLAGLRLAPGMVMLFGPRDEHELGIVTAILDEAHAFAAVKPGA